MMRQTGFGWLVLFAAAGLTREAHSSSTACVNCHARPELFGPAAVRMVQEFEQGVHAKVGLSCHDCHGGNPDPKREDDLAAAMDAGFGPNPYRGAPRRTEVPAFCGRCHSDPSYIKRFDPGARVDQEREYETSQHGQRLERGDARVATCIDCHGVHRILRADDPRSPVYPTRVAETCRSCHEDVERMESYALPDGRPLPVDQYARWRQSVHARALLEREDLSAPTCNDCHGNHGASPPELDSVAFVCGKCHGREAELFRGTAKAEGFRRHNEYLAAAGEEGCAACHAPPEPQARLTGVRSFGECATCHDNHAVMRPTLALLSPLPPTPCVLCHEGPSPWAAELGESEEAVRHHRSVRDALLASAEASGLKGKDRFDWLVDQALSLPFHTQAPGPGQAVVTLRPHFQRLFTKFRIGKTYHIHADPRTGEPQRTRLRSCDVCHAAEPLLADRPAGLTTANELLTRMQELTSLTAAAERTLLRARRGGVEIRHALLEIDRSVDAQIELEVLVHGFSADETSDFARKQDDGLEHAKAALEAGRRALRELDARRQGLAAFLVVILLVLASLALKIRQTY